MNDYKPCPICGSSEWFFFDTQGSKWGNAECNVCYIVSPEVRTEYDLSDSAKWHHDAIQELRNVVVPAIMEARREERERIAQQLEENGLMALAVIIRAMPEELE